MVTICSAETKAVVGAGAVLTLVHMPSSLDEQMVGIGLCALTVIMGDCGRLRDFVLSRGFLEPSLDIFKRDLSDYFKTTLP